MDKQGKPLKKAQPKRPVEPVGALKAPTQGAGSGVKNAAGGHDHKPIGRGSARGR